MGNSKDQDNQTKELKSSNFDLSKTIIDWMELENSAIEATANSASNFVKSIGEVLSDSYKAFEANYNETHKPRYYEIMLLFGNDIAKMFYGDPVKTINALNILEPYLKSESDFDTILKIADYSTEYKKNFSVITGGVLTYLEKGYSIENAYKNWQFKDMPFYTLFMKDEFFYENIHRLGGDEYSKYWRKIYETVNKFFIYDTDRTDNFFREIFGDEDLRLSTNVLRDIVKTMDENYVFLDSTNDEILSIFKEIHEMHGINDIPLDTMIPDVVYQIKNNGDILPLDVSWWGSTEGDYVVIGADGSMDYGPVTRKTNSKLGNMLADNVETYGPLYIAMAEKLSMNLIPTNIKLGGYKLSDIVALGSALNTSNSLFYSIYDGSFYELMQQGAWGNVPKDQKFDDVEKFAIDVGTFLRYMGWEPGLKDLSKSEDPFLLMLKIFDHKKKSDELNNSGESKESHEELINGINDLSDNLNSYIESKKISPYFINLNNEDRVVYS